MPNVKILVNFKTKKVVTTDKRTDSRDYQFWIYVGYELVGTIKIEKFYRPTRTSEWIELYKDIFIENQYFDPRAKKKVI